MNNTGQYITALVVLSLISGCGGGSTSSSTSPTRLVKLVVPQLAGANQSVTETDKGIQFSCNGATSVLGLVDAKGNMVKQLDAAVGDKILTRVETRFPVLSTSAGIWHSNGWSADYSA